jgi:hypothetical protein
MSTAVVISQQDYPIDLAISVWLDAKASRSGSEKTRQAYDDTLQSFRHALQRVGWGCPDFVDGSKSQVTTGMCSKAIGER